MASVQENIHTLSLIEFHAKGGGHSSRWVDATQKDQISLLDGIVLLMVFRANSEVGYNLMVNGLQDQITIGRESVCYQFEGTLAY
jgi:hypothetical protein